MATFDKLKVLETIRETGMVPVFYHKEALVAKQVLRACYEGGVLAFEIHKQRRFRM